MDKNLFVGGESLPAEEEDRTPDEDDENRFITTSNNTRPVTLLSFRRIPPKD